MFKNDKFLELLNRYHENKLAHAFLFETNDIDACLDDINLFLKQINCPNTFIENCNNEDCNFCRLLDNKNLPSYYLIEPDGTQIKKIQVQEIMEKFSTIPVYSKYHMYIVKNCDLLNVSSANSILKFLEEPNDNIIGFYVTSNKMSVLPTIRSRCQEISMFYDESFNYLKNIDKIQSLFNGIYKNKEAILYIREIAVNSFENRKEWIEFFTDVIYVFNDFYRTKSSDYGILLLRDFSDEKLVKLVLLLETILKYLQSNGNIELILDKLVIEMRNLDA